MWYCKVIPGESIIILQRLMIMDVWCSGKKVSMIGKKRKTGKLNIRWCKFIGNKVKEFIKKVKEKITWNVEGKIYEFWKRMATCIMNITKKVVGET